MKHGRSVSCESTLVFLHFSVFTRSAFFVFSQAFLGRCTPGSSPCAPVSCRTAGHWSRACSKTSAASRRTSTRRSWSHTGCRSCSRSSEQARSLGASLHSNKALVQTAVKRQAGLLGIQTESISFTPNCIMSHLHDIYSELAEGEQAYGRFLSLMLLLLCVSRMRW